MRAEEVPLAGVYFDQNGKPTTLGGILLRVVNALRTRTGGIRFEALGPLPEYTVATLPDAASNARCLIYVSDGTSNQRLAVSDGVNWRFPSGSIVS